VTEPSFTDPISGEPLGGRNDPTAITVRFDDGSQYRASVAAEQAARLKRLGKEVDPPTPRSRAWNWSKRNGWKLFTVVLAGYFASVLIPAYVQQWSDSQKELELKNGLVTAISDAVSDVTVNTKTLWDSSTVEGGALEDAEQDLRQAQEAATKPGSDNGALTTAKEQKAIDDATKARDKAKPASIKAERLLFYKTRSGFTKSSASIEARLGTYFGSSTVPAAWAEYRAQLLAQLSLFTTELKQNNIKRRIVETQIRNYVCSDAKPEEDLPKFCETGSQLGTGGAFRLPVIADLMQLRRASVLEQIRKANADGYMRGTDEYARAVVPFYSLTRDHSPL
jgi:hypothetical protein